MGRLRFAGLSAFGSLVTACAVIGPPVAVVVGPGGTPAPAPSFREDTFHSPSPTATAAAPAPATRRVRTDRPLDVAIAGPGYLVLASRPDPRDWADVTFTRAGELHLEFLAAASPLPGAGGFPVAGPGEWTLRAPDGRFVLGFEPGQDPERAAPPEGRGTAFTSAFGLGRGAAAPIRLATPAGLAPDVWLDFRGRVTLQGQPPVDEDGRVRFLYLAVAQVEFPGKLRPAPGGGFRYDLDAGVAFVGLAGLPAARGDVPRPVGDANSLAPGYLEVTGGI